MKLVSVYLDSAFYTFFISPSKQNFQHVHVSVMYLHVKNYILPITNAVCI